jgi:Domain of unknown function (DUF4158)
VQSVPAEFLSDQEAAAFGRYGGSVPLADLERFFYLDDADRKLVAGQREDHNRLGFSVKLATVRYIGRVSRGSAGRGAGRGHRLPGRAAPDR